MLPLSGPLAPSSTRGIQKRWTARSVRWQSGSQGATGLCPPKPCASWRGHRHGRFWPRRGHLCTQKAGGLTIVRRKTTSRRHNEEDTTNKWQQSWNESRKGRWTYTCVPDIRRWKNRDFGELTYYTTEMLTGHGNFQEFLCRINRASSDSCLHCEAHDVDTVEHTILKCKELREVRAGLHAEDIPDLVKKMLISEDEWGRITRRIDAIMKLKEKLGKDHEKDRCDHEAEGFYGMRAPDYPDGDG